MMNPRTSLALLVLSLPAMALAADAAKQELQDAMRTRPDLERGAELYRQCISCHGHNGAGQANGSVPRIGGQHYRVVLKQLVDFRHGKRWDFRMESLADQHHLEGSPDLADVALFVASQDRTGQPAAGLGDGDEVELGRKIFASRCQACHGAAAEGNDSRVIPRLAGQHYGYLQRQLYDAVDGRRPTMLRTHSPRLEGLDFQQVRALSDFLSRLDPWSAGAAP
jgi:cytochrome c553